MLEGIIRFSVRNRTSLFFIILLLTVWGVWTVKKIPLDAIPDIGDTQVIVYTEWPGRSPDIIEDQITYPVTRSLLSAPRVKVVRGHSYLGSSFVYVIFEDGTDIYWARSRVLEYLEGMKEELPPGVRPALGPDATGVGWGFSYALVDRSGRLDLSDLRTLQDWYLKYELEGVSGVSEVAGVGGFQKEYQITVNPDNLLAYDVTVRDLIDAVKRSNNDVAGRVIESSGREYMIRGLGYIRDLKEIESIPLGVDMQGTPVLVRDLGKVEMVPAFRRGLADLDGRGEVVGGIVVVRFGESVLNVVERVKARIEEIGGSLPEGVEIIPTYDRSELIRGAVRTLGSEIVKLSLAVLAVCLVFLFHLPSALVIILTLPVAILVSFICMYYLGVSSNIMSLGGIAIAIGAMVDAAIIMVENVHKRLGESGGEAAGKERMEITLKAVLEVGPSLFFSLLVVTAGFIPIFGLEGRAGRLFSPLAYTKTFAMLFASFLSVTLVPVLTTFFIRSGARREEENPFFRFLQGIYGKAVVFSLKHRKGVLGTAVLLMLLTFYPVMKMGSEFMPPLFEGSLFYMPVTLPGISITEARRILQLQDRLIKEVPEVSTVFGKAGRADTATDPAPLEMFETVINLKPRSEWRNGTTLKDILNDLRKKLALPGLVNSFTMPIRARLDMLSTGIRTPLGIKVHGPDVKEVERIGMKIEKLLADEPEMGTVYADRINTGTYLDIEPDRVKAGRYGLNIGDINEVIETAIGGSRISTIIKGRERYSLTARYPRERRDSIDSIGRILVSPSAKKFHADSGLPGPPPLNRLFEEERGRVLQIPLSEVADIRVVDGPSLIKTEDGFPVSYVSIDPAGNDAGSIMENIKRSIASLTLPPGYRLELSGEFQYMKETRERLYVLIPVTLLIIGFLLHLNTRSWQKVMIVLLSVPFSLIGSFWLLYLLGYKLSTAVWVGLIALAGIDAETGVIMLLYLDIAYNKRRGDGGLSETALREAVMEGAVRRLRPKIMTASVIVAGLLPLLFGTGPGSDVMKRIAAPMVGGVVTSVLLELLIYPVVYSIWRGKGVNVR